MKRAQGTKIQTKSKTGSQRATVKLLPRSVVATGKATRVERDSMGELAVPAEAYYGVQTARAIENFPISDLRFPRAFIRAMGLLKWAGSMANQSLGLLEKKVAGAIQEACWVWWRGNGIASSPWISSRRGLEPRPI